MTTRFRGITVREGALVEGAAGWGEWSPFVEYPPEEAEAWLRCAEEAAAGDWPEPVRGAVPVNVTVPVLAPDQARALVLGSGCSTAKVKVADPGLPLADDLDRVEAVRDALGPSGRGRAGVRRAAVRVGGGPRRRTPSGVGADRGRRVDPAGGRPLPRPRPRGCRHRGPEGAAAGWGARLPPHRRRPRDAGGRLVGARDVARAGGRGGAGGGTADARPRV